jgi:hypothetical protein
MFMTQQPPRIEFLCSREDHGVIAPPVPARDVMPEWFKRLPATDRPFLSTSNNALTVKRCMPFLDALTTGWIIPLAATVRLEIRDDGHSVETGWDFDKTMVSSHNPHQVAGAPQSPRPPNKFHNYWSIRTPKGWSCLFVPPLNRPHPCFEIVAGIVDTDTYHAHINFPFFAIGADGMYTLEKGTPIAQVIPFRRDAAALPVSIRAESDSEAASRQKILRNTQAGDGWYRQFARSSR